MIFVNRNYFHRASALEEYHISGTNVHMRIQMDYSGTERRAKSSFVYPKKQILKQRVHDLLGYAIKL